MRSHSQNFPCDFVSPTFKRLGGKLPFLLFILVTLYATSPVRPTEAVKTTLYRHAAVPDALLRLQQDARSLIELHESYYQPQQAQRQSSGNAFHQQPHHGVGRHLLQSVLSPDGSTVVNETGSVLANATILLATDRTRRMNPINEFKYYIGGWNLSSDDYWASVTFSVVYAPVIGFAWLLLGVGFVLFLVSLFLFCRARWDEMRDPAAHVYSPQNISLLLYALVVGSMIVITGFGLMIAGSVQLNDRLGEIGDYTIKVTNATTTAVYNVASAIQVTAGTRINEQLLQPEQRLQIFEFSKRVTSAALELNDKITNSDSELRDFGKKMSTTVFIVGCIAFAFVVLTVVAAILQWATFSHVMCTLVWITAFVTWCIVAVFLTVVTVSADTESAVKEVTLYPSLKTAFHRWVPCLNETKLGDAARFARFAAYDVISFTNGNIQGTYPKLFSRLNATAGICSPFGPGPDYLYNDTACPPNSISFRQLKDLLPEVTCPDSGCPRGKDGKPPLDMLPAAVAKDVRLAWISVDRLDGSVPLVAALSNCSHVSSVAKYVGGAASGVQSAAVLLWTGAMVLAVGAMVVAVAAPLYVFRAMRCLPDGGKGADSMYKQQDDSALSSVMVGPPVLAYAAGSAATHHALQSSQPYPQSSSQPYPQSSSQPYPPPPPPYSFAQYTAPPTSDPLAPPDQSHAHTQAPETQPLPRDASMPRDESLPYDPSFPRDSSLVNDSSQSALLQPQGDASGRITASAQPGNTVQGGGRSTMGATGGNNSSPYNLPTGFGASGYGSSYGYTEFRAIECCTTWVHSLLYATAHDVEKSPDPISLAVSSATGLAVFVSLFTSYLNPWDEDDDAQQHWHFPPKESAEARRVRWASHIRQRLKTLVPPEERVQGKAPCTAEQLIREIRSAPAGGVGPSPRALRHSGGGRRHGGSGRCPKRTGEDAEEADEWAECNSGVGSALLRKNRGLSGKSRGCAQRGPAEEFVAAVAEMEGADPVFALGPRYATRRVVREALALLSEDSAVTPSDG
ncbi:unnamed protein product [Closterium sp. Yama58-4]|nr:unnamed protein product [Closterium sp. Yama58-4]